MKHTPQLAIDMQHLQNFGRLSIANTNYIKRHYSYIEDSINLTDEQLDMVVQSERLLWDMTNSALAAREAIIKLDSLASNPSNSANILHIKCAQDALKEVAQLDVLIEALEENIDQLIEFNKLPR
jgi:hypothetical protein